MKIKLVFKIIFIVVFMVMYLGNVLYANQINSSSKPLRIIWQNRDIAHKIYPAMGKGKVYVIDKNFIREVLGYSMQSPLFKKNDKNEWSQLALCYGIEKPSLLERVFDIRVYTDSTLVSITNASSINNYNMKLPAVKCKSKSGKLYFIKEERKWTAEGKGYSYEPDKIVEIREGEYFLHYVSLENFCQFLNKELVYYKDSNTYKIYNKQ